MTLRGPSYVITAKVSDYLPSNSTQPLSYAFTACGHFMLYFTLQKEKEVPSRYPSIFPGNYIVRTDSEGL